MEDSDEFNGTLQYNDSDSSRAATGNWAKDFSWSTRDGKDLMSDAAGGIGLSSLLGHETLELWKNLSPSHWRTVFGYYNISLLGR